MYSDFFGLKYLPFNNTPDPRFFYETPEFEEALASLIYATQERKGFVLVTGEVGSGKTLLSRLLLDQLPDGARTGIIHNPRLEGRELLLAICREFEIDAPSGASVAELSPLIQEFLLQQYSRDRVVVLILDEAQNLPPEAFEELRMLGNLEADDAKLLQVVILGQSELETTFSSPALVRLRQRIFRALHLRSFSREGTSGYVLHRLQVAGWRGAHPLFDDAAIDAVHEVSNGIPRLINQICDNAMLAAYTISSHMVSAELVRQVARDTMQPPEGLVPSAKVGLHYTPTAAPPSTELAAISALVATLKDEIEKTGQDNRSLLEQVREIQRATQEAVTPGLELRSEIETLQKEFQEQAAAARRQVQSRLSEALQQADSIRAQSKAVAADLAERITQTRGKLESAIFEAENSTRHVRDQTREALAEFRHVLVQIVERADRARRDVVTTSHDACGKVAVALRRLEENSKSFQSGLASNRDAAFRDMEAEREKLAAFRQEIREEIKQGQQESLARQAQVEGSRRQLQEEIAATQRLTESVARQAEDQAVAAQRLMEAAARQTAEQEAAGHRLYETAARQAAEQSAEAQRQTEAAAQQAAELISAAQQNAGQITRQITDLLSAAQANACQMTQQAATLFADAQSICDRQRDEAATLLKAMRESAEVVSKEVDDLRTGVRAEIENMRRQLGEAATQLTDARRDAVAIHGDLRTYHDNVRVEAQAIIRQADELRKRTEELLALPRQLIDETTQKAQVLGEMSRKTSSVVGWLSKAGEDATRRQEQLTAAGSEADEKIETLKRQTARVGQLVGIVRQLYGSLDARSRIEVIRTRLDQADDLCRSVVPREMENLRSIIVDQLAPPSAHAPTRPPVRSASKLEAAPHAPARSNLIRQATQTSPPNPAQRGSLGDIAARNQKLHQWLKETLAESEQSPGSTGTPPRINQAAPVDPARVNGPSASPPAGPKLPAGMK